MPTPREVLSQHLVELAVDPQAISIVMAYVDDYVLSQSSFALSEEDVYDVFTTAVESGYSWFRYDGVKSGIFPERYNLPSVIEELDDFGEVEATYLLPYEQMRDGILREVHRQEKEVSDWVANHDVTDADNAVQMALLREIVYG